MRVYAYTDGSIQPRNPGKVSSGAAVLYTTDQTPFYALRSTFRQSERETNNMGEITGILNAIRMLSTKSRVTLFLHSDSKHALQGVRKIIKQNTIFKTNSDLWESVRVAIENRPRLTIVSYHVPGHSGDEMNDLVHWASHASAYLKEEYHIPRTSDFKELEELVNGLKKRVRAEKREKKKAKAAGLK